MKLRQKPSDFIVEEIPLLKLSEKGNHAVYKVTKISLTTHSAEKIIARYCKVNYRKIGFAGLKDNHAKTTQYFSVETTQPKLGNFKENNIKSELIGFTHDKIKTGQLVGNKFIITARALSEKEVNCAKKNKQFVQRGVPNYYDSQRFGSLKGTNGFIAKDILLGKYEEALKKVLTAYNKNQKKEIKEIKNELRNHWGDWNYCLNEIRKRNLERTVQGGCVSILHNNPKDFLKAFRITFPSVRQIFFAAYQSFIWNECVKEIVKKITKDFIAVKYEAGVLFFPRAPLPKQEFPSVSSKIPENSFFRDVIQKVLQKENLTIKHFNTKEYEYISRMREVTVIAEKFFIEFSDDERNKGKKKAIVSFELPKGSYATIIMKGLFEVG